MAEIGCGNYADVRVQYPPSMDILLTICSTRPVQVYASFACYYLHQMWRHPLDEDDATLSARAAGAWNGSGCDLAETCAFVEETLWVDGKTDDPEPGEEIVVDCREMEEAAAGTRRVGVFFRAMFDDHGYYILGMVLSNKDFFLGLHARRQKRRRRRRRSAGEDDTPPSSSSHDGYFAETAFVSQFMELSEETRRRIGHSFVTTGEGDSYVTPGMFRRCTFKGIACNDSRCVPPGANRDVPCLCLQVWY